MAEKKPKAAIATARARSPARAEAPSTKERALRVVGIGASAGGLEAFEQFFTNMPADKGIAFVIVQHLDPTGHSSMPQILSRFTKMRVKVATDGMRVEPDSVYLLPPNKSMGIQDGALYLQEPTSPPGLRLPIDFFFRSLAKEMGPDAICMILSGTGTDGTLGLRAVKADLGTVFVQDPESAKYDGMPRSAIDTGLADFVLKPNEMPEKLLQFVQHSVVNGAKFGATSVEAVEPLKRIFAILRTRTGRDFSRYKQTTVRRRLQRRMSVNQISDIGQYAGFLKENEGEVRALLKDLLISVTNFFRDPEAFEALKKHLKELIRGKQVSGGGGDIRVWVAGCATGEEAYSVAITVSECLAELERHAQVQMYATDVDVEALQSARAGKYPANIAADVTASRLKQFFIKENDSYRVKKEIREAIVFAPQDFIKDPPFSKMDLICCRNLLIYLESDVQKRLVPLLHYALKPGGILFLGPSESTGGAADLFDSLDRKWKIYRRRDAMVSADRLKFPAAFSPSARGMTAQPLPEASEARIPQLTEKIFLDSYAPTFAVIDEKYRLVYVRGRTGRFLEIASGQPTWSVLEMAREGLRSELASAMYRAASEKKKVLREGVRVRYNGGFQTVNLTVAPLTEPGIPPGLLMIVFQETGETTDEGRDRAPRSAGSRKRLVALEDELRLTKENLQTTIEEMEATNEELKSANEELQSNNEELQSTNEELDTSREELQSLNEELTTLNAEIQDKNEQLTKANDDLKNFLNRTDIALIFLDEEMRIRSYTPATSDVFSMREIDIGRPLAEITSRLAYDRVVDDAQMVLGSLRPEEMEVQRKDGCWYKMRILPYLTAQNVVSGLVISFLDINDQKKAADSLRETRDYLDNLFNHANAPIIVWDPDFKISRFNGAFEQLTGRRAADMLGNRIDILFPADRLEDALAKVSRATLKGERWEVVEIPIQHADGSVRTVLWNSATIFDADGKNPVATIAQGQDITERKRAETERERLHTELSDGLIELQTVLDTVPIAVWVTRDPEARNITGNIYANELFGVESGANISRSAPPGEAAVYYQVLRDGIELRPEQLPAHVAATSGKPVAPQELEFRFKDGRRLYMLTSAVPLIGRQGQVRGAVVMGADMTEQKQDMDVKDAFIGMVSHEIKTPLTVIIGALSTVRTARLDSKEASGLMSDAITSADILNGIVDNMLEISRSQSRRLALNKAQVDVAVVVRGAVDKLRSRSDIHDLVVDIRGSLPPVFVDRARLERVLNNLIDNAIKYSPKGGEVRVTARQENGQLVVSVIDHGIGISAEDQGRLFRSFERIDNQAAGPTPGVGLGLNVCRILVESHGGKIWVESEPGKGSTFTFSVPLGKR